MPTIKLISLGCSKNTVDSEVLAGNLKAAGYRIIPETDPHCADVVIVNTCGFILDAKQESIDTILREVARKNRRKRGKLVVMGCLVGRYGKELKREIPDVDAWVGVNDLDSVLKAVLAFEKSRNRRSVLHPCANPLQRRLSTPRHYAYLKVSEGCNRRCAFCAIPGIRGGHISRPQEEILEEARLLAKKGVKEIILVAQDLCYYGMDIYGRRAIADLVRALCRINGIRWIRLQYLYPHAFPKDLLEVMRTEPKVCKYVDIPLQHINTAVLKSMSRSTTRKQTLDLLAEFKRALPEDTAFRTTMITGFPTETPAAFEELKKFIEDFRFDRLGVFPYSLEENTPAYALGDPILQEEKERRAREIMDLQEEISLAANRARIGSVYEVLIDRKEGEFYVGRTQYDSPEVDNEVLIAAAKPAVDKTAAKPAPQIKIGEFYRVRIIAAEPFDLYGEILFLKNDNN